MIRVCTVCGVCINNIHGNAKKCVSCQKKHNAKIIRVHPEENVTMTVTRFRELQRGYDTSKALTLASTLHLATCYKADKWLVRVNKHNVELLHWYEKEVAKK